MTSTAQRHGPAWTRRLLAGLDAGTPSLDDHQRLWGPLPAVTGEQVVEAVRRAGLLGRGGAGFPAARKMLTVATGRGKKVVVANGAEGEPASAKDALLLTRAPHLVLDGVQLAARAVAAKQAHLVVHGEGGSLDAVHAALAERRDEVPVAVHELPSAYVASEETALVHWLNGGEAKPTFTPPRPFESGVNGRPTLVNNVETLAHVATIARYGPDWFRGVGDPDEPGTLLVTVSGAAMRRNVAEVATGTPIGEVLSAGGLSLGDTTGVLVGGYFGTWLPADLASQLPLSHRALQAAGGALGAGVLVALPPEQCGVVEAARVAAYLAANNAGQCGPCLNGLPAIAGTLARLARGPWDDRLWPRLERWLSVVPGRGACRHPDGAVRFVATGLSVFAADVHRHRTRGPCRAASARPFLPLPVSGMNPGWR